MTYFWLFPLSIIYMLISYSFSKEIAYNLCKNKPNRYTFKSLNKQDKEERCGYIIIFFFLNLIPISLIGYKLVNL